MAVRQINCPSCAAPLQVTAGISTMQCSYCTTSLKVERSVGEVQLAIASQVSETIQQGDRETQSVIQENTFVTQSELRRLQLSQDLANRRMQLSQLRSEVRAVERAESTSVTRRQLQELHKQEAELLEQIARIDAILNPPLPGEEKETSKPDSGPRKSGGSGLLNLLFSFSGRIGRSGFWWGTIIASIVASFGYARADSSGQPDSIGAILVLLAFWIFLAVQSKRLHDRGKSAWWLLLWLMPPIASIWFLIELGFLPGKHSRSI